MGFSQQKGGRYEYNWLGYFICSFLGGSSVFECIGILAGRKALEVKDLIRKEFERVFKGVDVIISPTVSRLPHKIGEDISAKEMYSYDLTTIPANLAGICAVSVPGLEIKGVPVGLQVMGKAFDEGKMFSVARVFE